MEYVNTADFRGARFRFADLSGTTFRECDLSGVRISSSQVADLRITGFDGDAGTVFVDDVDVSAYVTAELDRRYPERVQLREARTADDVRTAWTHIDALWEQTTAKAAQLPEGARTERVDGEWSFVETLRHLVFATDGWLGRMVLGEDVPYHRLALPPTDFPPEQAGSIGLSLEAEPTFEEASALHADRRARIGRTLAGLHDDELDQVRTAVLAPLWGEESQPVRYCLLVLLREHVEHRRFAERDLAQLA